MSETNSLLLKIQAAEGCLCLSDQHNNGYKLIQSAKLQIPKIPLIDTFRNKVNFIRYADDFVIAASSAEVATQAKALIQPFLQTRGLKLSEEKTLITNIDDVFDMLGWKFRKYKEKLIIKPSNKSVKTSNRIYMRSYWKRDMRGNKKI